MGGIFRYILKFFLANSFYPCITHDPKISSFISGKEIPFFGLLAYNKLKLNYLTDKFANKLRYGCNFLKVSRVTSG